MGLFDKLRGKKKDEDHEIANNKGILPIFKYHPNAYKNGTFSRREDGDQVVCQCCNRETEYFYETMYCVESVDCLCPACIANGEAAKRFNGDFIQSAETTTVDDKEKMNELFHRTPGYVSWQGENWLACCGDFCAFIGDTNAKELRNMGILNEVVKDFETCDGGYDDTLGCLENGILYAYLFQCLHCGKYRIWMDAD